MLEPLSKALKTRVTAVVWALLGLVALGAVGGVMNFASREHLRAEAEQAALNWADYVARSVPDLDLIFEGDVPSALAQDHLTQLRSLGEVFRFEFFDHQGRLLLASDSLGAARAESPDADASRARAAGVAQRGRSDVTLVESDGARQPRLYSEAYVPVRLAGRSVGVVKVFVDQTGR